MNFDEETRIINAVAKWMEIHLQALELPPTVADAMHSALLRRLIRGLPPLPKPPPRCFSYPCYELGEGKPYEALEATFWPPDEWCIDQCSDWRELADGRLLHTRSQEVYHWIRKPVGRAGGILQKDEPR